MLVQKVEREGVLADLKFGLALGCPYFEVLGNLIGSEPWPYKASPRH